VNGGMQVFLVKYRGVEAALNSDPVNIGLKSILNYKNLSVLVSTYA